MMTGLDKKLGVTGPAEMATSLFSSGAGFLGGTLSDLSATVGTWAVLDVSSAVVPRKAEGSCRPNK